MNEALGWSNDELCLVLGILDIYGFEIFEVKKIFFFFICDFFFFFFLV